MTEQELREIEQRAEKATAGPLELMRYDHGGGRMGFFGDPHKGEKRKLVADFYAENDREFYYAARTDIPALLAEVRRLREENKAQALQIDVMDGSLGIANTQLAILAEQHQAAEKHLKEINEIVAGYGTPGEKIGRIALITGNAATLSEEPSA